jgi:hypothetical protein
MGWRWRSPLETGKALPGETLPIAFCDRDTSKKIRRCGDPQRRSEDLIF